MNISNTASTTSGVFDPDTSDNTATELSTGNNSADLALTKSDSPDPVLAGTNITYTLTVTNNGPSDATGVSLSDAIPAGTSFVSATGGGTLTAGVVGWNLTTITSGANKSVTLVVKVDSSRTTNISNTASTTSGVFDPDTSDNTATELTTVNTSANLALTKSDSPDPVLAGNNITYTLTVTNNGPSDATGVSLSDAIPAGTSFVSATGGGTLTAGVVGWNLTTITSGANKSVTLVVKVDSSRTTNISNTASTTSGVFDPDTSDNTATELTTVNTSANLALTKSDSPDPVLAGNNITYTLTVTNNGPSDATGVSLSDAIPAGTSFVSATGGGTLTAGVVGWNLTTITSGANKSVTLVVKVDSSRTTNISNTASTTSGVFDPDTSDNTATELTTVNTSANLALTKSDSPDPVLAGNNITYTLTVTNNGPSDATGVSLSDAILFFNDTATTEIYTLSLHDALPIYLTTITSGANKS